MVTSEPNATTWCLRFKNGKETTLLHVDPLTNFKEIKTELLQALRATHPTGTLLSGTQIPSDESDIQLARAANATDYSIGEWIRIRTEDDPEQDDEVDGANSANGKPKSTSKKASGGKGEVKTPEFCPQAANLKDGSVIAYSFSSDGRVSADSWHVIAPSLEDTTVVEQNDDEGGMVPRMEA